MDLGPDDYCIDLHRRDTSYVTLSDMPLAQITGYKQRKGWTVPFYSSRGTTFSDDCGAGRGFGLSVFLRDGDKVYRTYFTSGRGVDRLRFEWEEPPGGWPRAEAHFAVTQKDRPGA